MGVESRLTGCSELTSFPPGPTHALNSTHKKQQQQLYNNITRVTQKKSSIPPFYIKKMYFVTNSFYELGGGRGIFGFLAQLIQAPTSPTSASLHSSQKPLRHQLRSLTDGDVEPVAPAQPAVFGVGGATQRNRYTHQG